MNHNFYAFHNRIWNKTMTCKYISCSIFSKIKYYLTPATACANNVFPHPGGP